MILSIFGFMITIAILCILCYKLKIIYPIIVKSMGIILMILSALEYIMKFSRYATRLNFEYTIYLKLSNIKISCGNISVIGICGIILIMIASLILVSMENKARRIYFWLIPIAVFGVLNFPLTEERIYIWFITCTGNSIAGEIFLRLLNIYGVALLICLMVYPYYKLLILRW